MVELPAVILIITPSLHRHCERLEKPRGNPCGTVYAGLKMDRHASLAMTRKLIVMTNG
jgi:hypothetical protein